MNKDDSFEYKTQIWINRFTLLNDKSSDISNLEQRQKQDEQVEILITKENKTKTVLMKLLKFEETKNMNYDDFKLAQNSISNHYCYIKLILETQNNEQGFIFYIRQFFSLWRPDNPCRLSWDLVSMIFILIQMLQIPLMLSFEIILDQGTIVLNYIMDCFFILDIFIQFNSGMGHYIHDRKQIIITYLKFWFWIDLIASIPYDIIIELSMDEGNENQDEYQRNAQILKALRFLKFFKVLRLVRALKLKQIVHQIQDFFGLGELLMSFINFLKLCLIIFCLAHWCGCVFHLIASTEDNIDHTWLSQSNVYYVDSDWQTRYLTAFYFWYSNSITNHLSLTTMTTVGYGDVHPVSQNEMTAGIFIMIIASGVFGYTMNNIMTLFDKATPEEIEIQQAQEFFKEYAKKYQLPKKLSEKVQDYLDWQLEENSNNRIRLATVMIKQKF